MIGSWLPIADLYASTITCAPSAPSAPPCSVASDANTTTRLPLISPVAATIPQSVRGISSSNFPLSNNFAMRTSGSRSSIVILVN